MNPSLQQLLAVCDVRSQGPCSAIDVGAHHGEFARFLVASGAFDKVVSFEPNPENFDTLSTAVTGTATCRYQAINMALGAISGPHDFHCNADTATGSLLNYAPRPLRSDPVSKRTVDVITLDEYLVRNPLAERPRLLKIDTQGGDLSVIRGARRAITEHRPIIQAEFIYIPLYEGQCSPAGLTSEIEALGYEMYSLNNLHVTPEGRLAFCDALFVPAELQVPVTQQFSCIDDQISFRTQLDGLSNICAERLAVINVLDAEVQRLGKLVRAGDVPVSLEKVQ